ncbi:MAG: heavy metal translocating P-type ATPase [Desulfuromonadales bacterium]
MTITVARCEIVLPVGGMSCQKCVRKVTDLLTGLDGVDQARVSLEQEEARIFYDPALSGPTDMEAVLVKAGFHVAPKDASPPPEIAATPLPSPERAGETERLSFAIRGMHCANCAGSIEKKLRSLAGVQSVRVSYAGESGSVAFHPGQSGREEIFQAVRDVGYQPLPAVGAEDLEKEARLERNWLIYAAVLTAPIMPLMWWHPFGAATMWVMAALATLVQFSAGLIFYRGAWTSLKNASTNMDVLVAMGISAAYFYSVFAAFGWFGAEGEVFFETGAMLIVFIRFGKWLEARAKGKAGQALRALLRLQPDEAVVQCAEGEKKIAAAAVRVDDRVVVRAGEKFPIDGVVEEGASAVDESMLTGESAPVAKEPGSEVAGGTINLSGRLLVRATRVGEETALAQIARLIAEAQADKAPIQRMADTVSNYFVPAVVSIALLTFFIWRYAAGAEFLFAFKLAIAVLVIACPCALGLATPTAIMVGSSVGLSAGILFKRATVLENISRLDVLLFDKTGTLTQGKFAVTDLVTMAGVTRQDLLTSAVAAEAASSHPLAWAVVQSANQEGVTIPAVAAVREHGGHGLVCTLDGARLVVGNERLLREEKVDPQPLRERAEALAAEGKSLIHVARDGSLLGLIALADTLKPEAAATIGELKKLRITTALITGDRRTVAEAVGRQLAIDLIEAEVLPEEKEKVVRRYQEQGRFVGMVGDGINDAPALARADIGIAIGSGTDVAKETGDIVLIKGDIRDVERGIRLGRRTLTKIKQNLFWAFFYNIVGIPVAAGVFYPVFGLILRPEFAGLAMAFSSVSVVTNSLLLNRLRKRL